MMIDLSFHGGAGTVTGSRHLLRADDTAVLVDVGMFQGLKELRELNWKPPSFDIGGVDHLLLTHSHIDHAGYLPRLVKLGYRGTVHCTPASRDLAEILLLDSAKIQEEDARYANKRTAALDPIRRAAPTRYFRRPRRARIVARLRRAHRTRAIDTDLHAANRRPFRPGGSAMREVVIEHQERPVGRLVAEGTRKLDAVRRVVTRLRNRRNLESVSVSARNRHDASTSCHTHDTPREYTGGDR